MQMEENKKIINNTNVLHGNERLIKEFKQHLTDSEGVRGKIYLDPKGVPTIGIGIALGSINDEGEITIFTLAEINKILAQTGPNSKLSQKEYDLVVKSVGNIRGTFSKEKLRLKIEKENEDLKNDIFLSLNKTQIHHLLDKEARKRLKEAERHATNLGINLQSHINHEGRLIIADLYFQGSRKLVLRASQNITKALQNNNKGMFVIEILYRSNKSGLSGIDKRRFVLVEKYIASLKPEERTEVFNAIDNFTKTNPKKAQEVHERFDSLNKDRAEQKRPPLDYRFTTFKSTQQKIAQKNEPKGKLVNGKIITSLLNMESTSSSTPVSEGESISDGGEVQVRAHTRENYNVRAHTRSAPHE